MNAYNSLKNTVFNMLKYSLRFELGVSRPPVSAYLEWTLLRDLLRLYQINCVFDVGANVGQFARNLRRIGYDGYICSFEPVKSAFEILETQFKGDPKWRGYNWALGCQDAQQPFNVIEDATNMSSFLALLNGDMTLRTVDVKMRRLDSIFSKVVSACRLDTANVFVKLDTQGYDLEVIRGGEKCLDRILGIQSEVSVQPIYSGIPHYLDVLRYYEELGFHLCSVSDVLRDNAQNRLVEINCILMRPLAASL